MARFDRILFIILVTACLIRTASSSNAGSHLLVRRNVTVGSSNILLSDSFTSLTRPFLSACNVACVRNSACLSAVYELSTKTCFLFDILNTHGTSPNSGFVLLQNVCLQPPSVECCYIPITAECGAPLYKDCQQAFEAGDRRDGQIYYLRPNPDTRVIKAICQFDESAGWTVIQRRLDGSVDFFQLFQDYVDGFGSLDGEYWLGLESIYQLTRNNQKVSFLLESYSDGIKTANYSMFYIDGSANDYTLHISGYSGDAGDAMTALHNGMKFSTRDHDLDILPSVNCAENSKGAWWYRGCHDSNLNGVWYPAPGGGGYAVGINWLPLTGHYNSLKASHVRITTL